MGGPFGTAMRRLEGQPAQAPPRCPKCNSSVLQGGLDALFDWSLKWQLNVSAIKCVMLQLGHTRPNRHFKYNSNNLVLPNVTEVKDLGITVNHELKFTRHIRDITTRAHQRASLILRCFKSKDPSLLLKAFVTYVRPLLEYKVYQL